MKAIPKIQKYMTTAPYAINGESNLEEAAHLMKMHNIRHLPVVKGPNRFGLLSERDIKNLMSYAGISPKTTKVGDVCADEPFVVNPESSIATVAAELAEKKYGSALVVDNGKLVGIFTLTDACWALSEICEQRFHS